jgi:predicted ATPase/DNA-binding SARP family transcriptional activator
MQVRVLGPVEVDSDGERIATSANQRLVFAVLSVHANRIVSTDALAEALWGRDQPQDPPGALQNLMSRIRSRLSADEVGSLATRPPGYGLFVDAGSLDRLLFEQQIASSLEELQPDAAIRRLRDALSLWRGDAYAEFADVDILRDDATRLEELRATTHERLLGILVAREPAAAVADLEALVAASPFRERGHALLIEALYRSHRRRDALQAAARYRTLLVEELGLDPSHAIRELEQAILDDDLPAAPHPSKARTATPARSSNLPTRRQRIIGRDHDLRRVCELLGRSQIVTLTGVGGTGKTTLAVEVGRAVADAFADGVWLIDLVGLRDGAQLAHHAAATIAHLHQIPDDDPIAAIGDQLADRRALIVLDNCEHLANHAARLVDAVASAAPDVRILATSRRPLRVEGESVHRLQPLDVPTAGSPIDDVLTSASVELFVERVSAADSSFQPDETDRTPLTAICRRLDGLPLALELAAARVPSLGLRDLAERLDDRFGLLTDHHLSPVARHQTLKAAIDWSVDLLEPAERDLLGTLSVFVDSFDLDAAEAVGGTGPGASTDVAHVLATLVDQSLVVAFRQGTEVRYRLLETIRHYALDLLGDRRPTVERAHRDHYVAFSKHVGDHFLGATNLWYQRLRADFPNLRTAYRWSLEHGEIATAVDLVASLRWAPYNTGHLYQEHRAWIEEALPRARAGSIDDEILARGLVAAGSVATLEGRSHEGVALLSEALELLAARGAHREAMWCEMWLAAVHTDLGHLDEGVEHAASGLALAHDTSPVAVVYLANQHAENAAAAALLQPSPQRPTAAYRSHALAVETAVAHDVEEGLLRAEHGLAILSAPVDPRGSLTTCLDALQRWRALGEGNRLVMALVSTARVAVLAREYRVASRLLLEALDEMERVGWRQPFGRLLEAAAVVAASNGSQAAAATLADAARGRFLTPRWYVALPSCAGPNPLSASSVGGPAATDETPISDDRLAALVAEVARQVLSDTA